MSDYLGHLLERSFTPVLQVRPQTPSLFEPPPSTRLVERPADFDLESHVESVAATPPTSERLRNNPVALSADPMAFPPEPVPSSTDFPRNSPAGKLPPGGQTLPEIIPEKIESVTMPTKMPAKKTAGPRSETDNGFQLPGPTEAPKTIVATKPVPNRPVKNAPFETPPLAPSVARSASASNRETEKKSPAAPTHPVEPRPSRAVAESTTDQTATPVLGIRPRSVVVSTHIPAPAVSPANNIRANGNHATPTAGRMQNERRHGESALSSPSTIQVTIGRVEIRATPPPAPVRAPARKDSGMSLDTYLQRRAEGGRH